MNVTALKISPTSSIRCPTSPPLPSPQRAEHEASDERGDEAGTADRICNSEGEAGAGERHDLEPGATDEPVPTGDDDDACGGDARNHPGEDAVADLLEHEPSRGPVADGSGLCLRDREHDPEQRHADPVVEAALDVQSLSNAAREPHERDDRLAERRVGRSEDHREEQRLGPQELGEHDERDDEAQRQRQGQADPEQTQRHRELAAQRAHVDPRGVREQDERKRRLGEQLDRLAGRRDLDQPQRLRADEQPDGGEDHRGGDRRTRDPAGDRRECEQSQRDDGNCPVHGPTLFSLSSPAPALQPPLPGRCDAAPVRRSRATL